MKNTWHVATAAEAIAAAQFARCGWDVSVQYGANQPEYDLIVADAARRTLMVSVKGSRDGQWGLTQSHIQKADYHGAIDKWLARHSARTIFCLVQFKGVAMEHMPRIYLATPAQIAQRMKATAGGRGDTILYENHTWTARAAGAGTVDSVPADWLFTQQRLEALASHAP